MLWLPDTLVGRTEALVRLVGLVAATAGQLYVPAHLARAASVDAKTADALAFRRAAVTACR